MADEKPVEKPAKNQKDSGKTKSKYKRLIRLFWIVLLTPVIGLVVLISGIALFADLPDIEQLQNPESNLATVCYSSDGKELGRFYLENRVTVQYSKIDQDVINALIATEDERYREHSGIDARSLGRVFVKTFVGGDRSSGGGSTITQQLAKMQFHREADRSTKSVRTFQKLKEWIIAVRLERLFTKDEIIALYLNKYDFNYNAVGINSAAKVYFSTTSDSLKIEEAAVLVGMCQNPSRWNPLIYPDSALKRRNLVMYQMQRNGFLSQTQYDSLKALPIVVHFNPESHNEGLAPYFREYLRDNFLKKWCTEHLKPNGKPYDMYRDGLRVYTTIDSRMQTYGENAVEEHMAALQKTFDVELKGKKNRPFSYRVKKEEIDQILASGKKRSDRYHHMQKAEASKEEIEKAFNTKVRMRVFSWKGEIDTMMTPMDSVRYYKSFLQTGFMAMEPQTGYIRSWVGGINFRHFKYDHVKVSKRQVGSTFKPFIYALAIQEGYSPCDQVPCIRTCIPSEDGKTDWCPNNSWGKAEEAKYNGKMITLRKALALSINYVSAFIMKQFGPHAVVDFARNVGITSPLEPVPSLCLGTADISLCEMVGANCTFVNKGKWIEPTFITRIEDKNGKVLEEFIPKTKEALSEEKAYLMINLMQGVVDGGTGGRIRGTYKIMNPVAGKTGTTQNNSDGWFMGLTPDLVAGVWVGGEDRSVHFDRTAEGQGASMALPIWAKFFQQVYADKTIKISKGAFPKPKGKIMMDLDCPKFDDGEPIFEDPNDNIFGGDGS
ncbi:MAG: transglycosylase domain-containing protein [Bacteroidota bacterium]|nr:transglycosylase domain-containing protein [Bacteroidota bacterium]